MTAPASQPILPWLTLLAHLYPPKATLLIGAGAGTSPWVKHLQTANHPFVTLIEADEAKATRLTTATQNQPHWQVKQHVIAQHSAPTPFYSASLQTESGLLEPERLRSLWPNLKTTHQRTRQAISLGELQADAQTPANWLLVDCLPALPIIQGTFQDAAQPLAHFDVIAARVLLQDSGPNTRAATVDPLQLALQAQGFMCIAIETSRHPAIGHALFVYDTATQAAQKIAETAQVAAKAAAEQLQQFKVASEQAQDLAVQEAVKAKAATVAAAKQAEERAAKVQQLTQDIAAADKLATESQKQLDQLQAQLKQASQQAQAAAQEAEVRLAKTQKHTQAIADDNKHDNQLIAQQLQEERIIRLKLREEINTLVGQIILSTNKWVIAEKINSQITSQLKVLEIKNAQLRQTSIQLKVQLAAAKEQISEQHQIIEKHHTNQSNPTI